MATLLVLCASEISSNDHLNLRLQHFTRFNYPLCFRPPSHTHSAPLAHTQTFNPTTQSSPHRYISAPRTRFSR